MNHKQTLEELGLNSTEAAAYLALMELGGSQASAVAKHLGIKRTTIYDVLSSLHRKGFASVYFRQKKRIYHPQKPQRVSDHFEKKLEAFNRIIPELASLKKQEAHSLGLRLIQTKDELKQYYFDALETYAGKTYDIIGNTPEWIGALDESFVEQYRRARKRAKLKSRLILTANSEPYFNHSNLLGEWRFLPKEYLFESTINIFPDQVLIISPRFSALAAVIDSPIMVDVFHSIFDILWSFMDKQKKRSSNSH